MVDLPAGTATFLLAEIRAESRAEIQSRIALREDLDEDLPASEYTELERAARGRFDVLLAEALQARQGRLVRGRDGANGALAVFVRARDALATALTLQAAVESEPWRVPGLLQVAVAIHTGEVELRDGAYSGPEVDRCAALCAAAGGGQILLSLPSFSLVRHVAGSDVWLAEVGILQFGGHSERVFEAQTSARPGGAAPRVPLTRRTETLPRSRPR